MFQFRNEVKEKLEGKQKELTDCKKESRKRKKMIAVYQVSPVTRRQLLTAQSHDATRLSHGPGPWPRLSKTELT